MHASACIWSISDQGILTFWWTEKPLFFFSPPPTLFFFLNMVFLPHRAAHFEDFEDCCQQVIKICHLQLAQHYIQVQKHLHPSEVNALPYIPWSTSGSSQCMCSVNPQCLSLHQASASGGSLWFKPLWATHICTSTVKIKKIKIK